MAPNTLTQRLLSHLFIILLSLAPAALYAEIRLAGSSSILPVAKEAMKVFHEQTGITISIRGGGSSKGIAQTLDGSADIGMVSRPLNSSEGNKLQSHLIGYDGIAVITHSAIPIKAIDKSQLKAIYSGQIRNWHSLGGNDQEIGVVAKHPGHASRRLFDEHCSIQQILPNAQLASANAEAIVLVGIDPAAIGYVSLGPAEKAQRLGVGINILPLDGVAATRENIINGSYPLRRELNLVTRNEPNNEVQLFIAFMQSETGQEFLRRHHFVTLKQQVAAP